MLNRSVPVYFEQQLESVLATNIPSPDIEVFHIALEGESPAYQEAIEDAENHVVVHHIPWPGYVESYMTALKWPTQNDWVFLMEDDALIHPSIDVPAYIASNPAMRMATFFDHQKHATDRDWVAPASFAGTLAMLYHRSVIDRIPATFAEFQHPTKATMSHQASDAVVMLTCGEERLYVHHGGMVENIGLVSSWSNMTAEDQPRACKKQLQPVGI